MLSSETRPLPAEIDVAVVGSGFSGLAMAVRLIRAGRSDFILLERGADVGGTWRDNTYPGCACDVPSHLYSFSFAPNPEWSSTFSPQPEIQAYLRRVAAAEGVLPHAHFETELREAAWDGSAWRLVTNRGSLRARVLVAAAGPLSEPSIPDLPGLAAFRGKVFHSATWDHGHDLQGRRVAVVGTGASAIQFVPQIQPQVARLHLFQRTPPWVFPRRDRPLTELERRLYRRLPILQRAMRALLYGGRELFALPMLRAGLARRLGRLARKRLAAGLKDPELVRKVTPDYAPGCKRILLSNDYYPALAEDNVEVIPEAIAEVRESSVVTAGGTVREVDTIIFGTGFQVTDMPIARRLRGADGRSLAEAWSESMTAHRGTTVSGFPNLFLLLGPNTGLGHTSVVVIAEAQAGYVLDALRRMDGSGARAVDVRPEAQEEWNRRLQRRMRGTVWTAGGCASWYLDAKGRNTTLWPDFTIPFRIALRRFDMGNYKVLAPAPKATKVIVTGAAGGIGAATVDALRAQGAKVVGLDLRGGDGVIACDVRDQASVDRAVGAALERLGGLDVLINNAGVGSVQSAGESPDGSAVDQLQVNLLGPWRVTAAALPALRAARGRVVNVASGLAFLALPMAPGYSASKRALVAYSDALRHEFGGEITVTTVYPGYVRTGIHAEAAARGLSLEGVVPAEPLAAVVGTLVRAALGPPARDLATTFGGALAYTLLRILPRRLVDRRVGRRFRARLGASRATAPELGRAIDGVMAGPRHRP